MPLSVWYPSSVSVLVVLFDLLLLGESAALVGKFTSNLDRIAYALMSARGGCLRPYVSLDAAWCFDFGVRGSGVGVNGTRFQC